MTENKEPRFFYGYVLVLASFAILLITRGGLYSFGVFFEPMLVEFGWTRALTSGAYSLNMFLHGLLVIGAGKLNDRFGPRLVLTAGGLLWGLGYLLMSQVSVVWQLYLFYGVIMGIGFSGYIVPLTSTVARWFVRRRGMMTGIVMAGIGAGAMIMPLLAGWFISSYGWRLSFTALGISSLIFIISAAQFLKRDPQSRGQLPYGGTDLEQRCLSLTDRDFSLREAIHTRQLWMLWVIFLCVGFPMITVMVHIVIYATGLGIPAASAVNILSVAGGANIAGRIVMGSATDRIGNRPVLLIGLIILLASLVWLQFAKDLWTLYLFTALFGFAWGGSLVLVSPIVAELFGLGSHGVLLGFVDAGITVGGTIGPVLVGHIFDITGSYQLGFLICAMVTVVGLILALFLKPIGTPFPKSSL